MGGLFGSIPELYNLKFTVHFGANVFESLGLGWWDLLFHTINLLLLIIALRFLLFKPVKRMIEKHKAKLNEVFEENKRLAEEATALKDKYDKMMEEAKREVVKISADATKNAQRKADETITQANEQAKTILENARRETLVERERLKNDFKESVSKLAVDIAEKILQREVNDEDNKKIIEECLKQWEDK